MLDHAVSAVHSACVSGLDSEKELAKLRDASERPEKIKNPWLNYMSGKITRLFKFF